MRSAAIAIFPFLFVLGFGSVSSAQHFASTVHGAVRVTAAGSPIVVRLQLQQYGMTIQELFVRENRFQFPNVGEGRYTIVAEAAGYDTVHEDIDVPGDWALIDLHPSRNRTQPSGAVSVWDLKVPKSARRQFEAAKGALAKDKCANALAHLKKATHIYNQYGDAHKVMGECYAKMNQLEVAEQEFRRALDQPHTPELHLLLGAIYVREGKPELLSRQFELYREEKPTKMIVALPNQRAAE
jgi:tetratricopeptide (TPR) repeat protein